MGFSANTIGRFELLKLLGQGGMGEVFLCRDPLNQIVGSDSQVAIKTVFPKLMQDPEIRARFEAEARMLSPIHHPNVVRLIEWGKLDDDNQALIHFMAMEYIDGISLHSLSRRRRISFPGILDIALQIASGLQAIHAAHVVHRDLKPANIMITKEGVAKIIDFGIAKLASGQPLPHEPDNESNPKQDAVIGTVNYIAPEVLDGSPASIESDIYGLGLVIWEMLNGATPFKGSSFIETVRKVRTDSLTWSDTVIDVAPPGFTRLVSKMTAKDPAKRHQSASEVVSELKNLIQASTWQGSFGRASRFDLDIRWSEQTVDEIRKMNITGGELLFVLQEIEERLIQNGDERVKKSTPFKVETDLIASCIETYKKSRSLAANARESRLTTPQTIVKSPEELRPRPDRYIAAILAILLFFSGLVFAFNRMGTKTKAVALHAPASRASSQPPALPSILPAVSPAGAPRP